MAARDDAYNDWQSGMKAKALADKYEVSINTVKSWINRWRKQEPKKKDASKSSKRMHPSEEKVHPKKRGAPVGNTNAKGNKGGAPPGNTNNYRHGFYYDVLDAEEQAFLDANEQIIEAQELLNELRLLEIKERRLLRDLAELRAAPTGLALQSVTKFKKDTSTTAISVKEYIIRLETLLTQAQRGRMRCIRDLHQIKMDLEKLQLMKVQAGIGENNTEDEAAQEVLLKAIKKALKDEN